MTFTYNAEKNFLDNKTILITGASDGIGKACAKAYATYGATVILLGRDQQKLETVFDHGFQNLFELKSFIDNYLKHTNRLNNPRYMGHQVAVPQDLSGIPDWIHGTINNASFVGSSYQYIVNSKIGKLYVISSDTNDIFKVGEEVFLSISKEDIKILND